MRTVIRGVDNLENERRYQYYQAKRRCLLLD